MGLAFQMNAQKRNEKRQRHGSASASAFISEVNRTPVSSLTRKVWEKAP